MVYDYLVGAVSGMFGVIISHPFDTIKTYKQNSVNLPKNLNLSFLYRGLSAPLIGTSIEKSIVFGTYSWLTKNTDSNSVLKGLLTGFVASIMITPYERVKILKQQNLSLNINSIYKGFIPCALRDSIGFSIYFTSYEYMKNKTDLSVHWSFIFGGISGTISWIFIYPFDKVKTIIQSSNNTTNMISITCRLLNKNLYSGFSYALYRAIPLHAGTFYMYELLKK